MAALRAWIFALLATLLVLQPSGASARSEHYCRMLGRVVASCCCDEHVAAATPSSPQQVQIEGCCQRISSSNRNASWRVDRGLGVVAPAALAANAADLACVSAIARPSIARPGSMQAPLAIGPPLFVRHCAILS